MFFSHFVRISPISFYNAPHPRDLSSIQRETREGARGEGTNWKQAAKLLLRRQELACKQFARFCTWREREKRIMRVTSATNRIGW